MFGKSSTIIKTVSNTEELAEIDLRILLKTIRQSRKKTLDSLTFDFIELKLKNIELTKGGISLARNILSSDRPITKIPADIIHDLMYYLIKDADTKTVLTDQKLLEEYGLELPLSLSRR